jgi:hypothetical protein
MADPLMFGEWTPDQPKRLAGLVEAKGVIARGGAYGPNLDTAAYNAGQANTGTAGLGGAGYYDVAGNINLFLADATKLYKVTGRVAANVSKSGNYITAGNRFWQFEQYGTFVVAVYAGLAPQVYQLGVSTLFANLAGSPPLAEAVGRVLNWLIMGKGVTLNWSAFNDITSWAPNPAVQSGTVDYRLAGGDIKSIIGGETGTVFQERHITRMTYVGPPTVWQMDLVEEERGAIGGYAVAKYGRTLFYVAEDGVYAFDGYKSEPIGSNRIDKYLRDKMTWGFRNNVCLVADPQAKVLRLCFPAGSSGMLTEQLIYSFTDNKWTHDDLSASVLFNIPAEGYTAETIDTYPGATGADSGSLADLSIDSPLFDDGRRLAAGVSSTRDMITFAGLNRPAEIVAGEREIAPGQRGMITEIWPLTDAPAIAVSAGVQYRPNGLGDIIQTGPFEAMTRAGFCPSRIDARTFMPGVRIAGATNWTSLEGLLLEAVATGGR